MFINIVHSPYCPSPPIIENDELEAILAGSAEPGNYKVPMSLSPVRNDTDKAGNACLVVDACVNSGVYEKSLKDKRFQEFIIELALAWVEQKNDVELGREWSIPKMKHKGELVNHLVYRTKDVVISEVEQTEKKEEKFGDATGKSGVDKFELDEFARALPRPVLKLQKVKKNGIVNKLVIKFYLSLVESAKECTVDIEKNRVLFLARNKYFAEIDLPNEIDTELGNATFDVTQQCLELVLHCLN
ncbi:PIH1-domain-containing protein [Rozella allomycis CSF55]|uniref:PIH1 domain-containing protein 1 n=1 Tax=Rozella allomycis (strain CSF55) TaxID=988480 RepID=A0A075AUM5_ROZAC|nr:PIH domain-containing protein [Rozella allomycis CSF55]RKP18371.1 PIH1-domain-containing protein [Rozella allomycis CSF55]|eukprot:EPZ32422.1 PIH domain-containing protein [Rozella allomycis CSF55]